MLIVVIPESIRTLGSFPASATPQASAAEGKLEILQQRPNQAQDKESGHKYHRYDQYAHDIDKDYGAMAAFFFCRVFIAAMRSVKNMLFRFVFHKVNPNRADVHAMIGVGDNSGLAGIIRLIGNCGFRVIKGGRSGQNNVIVFIQGQQRFGAAEYIGAAVKCVAKLLKP